MPFLILSRAGYEDVKAGTVFAGASLYVNPALLSQQETDALYQAGARITVLPEQVDPFAEAQVQMALEFIRQQESGVIWVERLPAGAPERVSAIKGDEQRNTPPQPKASPGLARKVIRHSAVRKAGGLAGWALHQVRKHTLSGRPLLIIPYLGYGNANCLRLRGRVLVDEGFSTPSPEHSSWRNLIEFYKRIESDQVAGARVRATFEGIQQDAETDRGGYFSFEIVPPESLTTSGWHTVHLELIAPASRRPVTATAEVLVPPATARFGIISDMDDTVLWTNVTNRLKMMLMLARTNAHTRKPFKGVAAFYRALCDGATGNEKNPIFYVSSSPWHLFPPLVEFLRTQDIPVGPLMLKELGLRKLFGSGRHRTHKLDQIENILSMYPDLQFILIGDSGEQDPEIYAEVVKRHPEKVRVIYIRNVNPDPSRIEALDHLIDEVRTAGSHLVLAPDSEYAATHAAAEGLISSAGMAAVRSDKKADEASTPGNETM